ncbi:hypothetical protein RTM1035_13068 [Roseovarius sp. TM1035]|nr:hypothetical protein RTM1035_13068 [Roseovarius sp. TM1035]
MWFSLCGCAAEAAQVHGYAQAIGLTHGVNKERQTSAAIGTLSQRAVDLAGGDQRLGIRRAHPVHRAVNVGVGDGHAMTDDHRFSPFCG